MNRRGMFVTLAVGCTVFFLWLAVRNVDFAELGRVLAAARWRWLPPMFFVVGILDIGIRALRWRILLSRAVRAPLGELFRLSFIGLAVNNVLFARLGELLRAVLAARQFRLSLATTLASVVVERALDVVALLTLFVTAAFLQPDLVAAPLRRGGVLVLGGVVAALAFLIVAEGMFVPGGFLERRLRSRPKLHAVVGHLSLGVEVLRRPQTLVPVAALSLSLWMIDAVVYLLGAYALGLDGRIDYPRAVLVLSWAGAGAALPAVPGAIGTFEAMVKDIVVRLGVLPAQAFAYALFLHMTMYLMVTTVGLIFLYRVGLSLGGLQESLQREERASAP